MKKLFILVAATLFTCSAQAQTTKGTVAVAGKFGYTQNSVKPEKLPYDVDFKDESHSYTLAPAIGFFIKDNLELGVAAHFYRYKSDKIYHTGYLNDDEVVIERKMTSLSKNRTNGIDVYARQYKFLTEKLAVHGTLSVGLNKMHGESTSTHTGAIEGSSHYDYSFDRFTAALSPGVTYFASNKIGLHLNGGAMMYNKSTTKNSSEELYDNSLIFHASNSSYSSDGLQLSFTNSFFNFGLSYYISR